jgi:hypothetical protein
MNEEKMARICWNTNNWIKPSGKIGKSETDRAYELQFGFGHEEWLFDFEKLIDGYHYSYLQPIGNKKTHFEKCYNILLYTINNETKEQYWVGWINNVYVLTLDDKKIYDIYKKITG